MATIAARRRLSPPSVVLLLVLALPVVALVSLGIGPTGISLLSLPRAIAFAFGRTGEPDAQRELIVLIEVRLPRILLGAGVGAMLALAGTLLQGLFRNPLADPGLLGLSSGAALAAISVIVLGRGFAWPLLATFGVYALPVAAFAGSLATTLLLLGIARQQGDLAVGTLILGGIAISAMAASLSGILAFVSDDRELRDLTLWSMGSLAGASWPKVTAMAPFVAVMLLAAPTLVRALNGLVLGEAEAFYLGVDVAAAKLKIVLLTAAAVGAAVAMAGLIGFVGLIVPHVVRQLVGADHRFVVPASILAGANLMLIADIAARMAIRPAELPIGLVMAAIGAPILLHLVMKRRFGGMG